MRYVLIIVTLILNIACANQSVHKSSNGWETAPLNKKGLLSISESDVPARFLTLARTDYIKAPLREQYSQLNLDSAYLNQSTEERVLVFDIEHTDDVQVVYVIIPSGEIRSKYIHSLWK